VQLSYLCYCVQHSVVAKLFSDHTMPIVIELLQNSVRDNSFEFLELIDMIESGVEASPTRPTIKIQSAKAVSASSPSVTAIKIVPKLLVGSNAAVSTPVLGPTISAAELVAAATAEALRSPRLEQSNNSDTSKSAAAASDTHTAAGIVAAVTAAALLSPRLSPRETGGNNVMATNAASIVAVVTSEALKSPRLQESEKAKENKSDITEDEGDDLPGLPLWDHHSDSLHFSSTNSPSKDK
jgi:hypothetical protein